MALGFTGTCTVITPTTHDRNTATQKRNTIKHHPYHTTTQNRHPGTPYLQHNTQHKHPGNTISTTQHITQTPEHKTNTMKHNPYPPTQTLEHTKQTVTTQHNSNMITLIKTSITLSSTQHKYQHKTHLSPHSKTQHNTTPEPSQNHPQTPDTSTQDPNTYLTHHHSTPCNTKAPTPHATETQHRHSTQQKYQLNTIKQHKVINPTQHRKQTLKLSHQTKQKKRDTP